MKKSELRGLIIETLRGMFNPPKQRYPFEYLVRENEGFDFSTKQTGFDPETGQMSWDVKYKTNLDSTYKEIDEAVERLAELLSQDKNKEAQELLTISRLLRNKFSRYRTKHEFK